MHGPYTRLTVNVETVQSDELSRLAERGGLSVSALMRTAIKRFLENPVIYLPSETTEDKQLAYAE